MTSKESSGSLFYMAVGPGLDLKLSSLADVGPNQIHFCIHNGFRMHKSIRLIASSTSIQCHL